MKLSVPIIVVLVAGCGLAQVRAERENYGLRGPVHTVSTEAFAFEENGAMVATTPAGVVTFSEEGFRTEEVQYDENGDRLCTEALRRDGAKVLESTQDCRNTSYNHRWVHTYDECGRPVQVLDYDATGTLTRKTDYSRPRPGVTEDRVYGAAGKLEEYGIEIIDREKRVRTRTRYKNGNLFQRWRGTWDKENHWIEDETYYPKGAINDKSEHRTSRTFTHSKQRDGLTLETMDQAQGEKHTKNLALRDKSGRLVRQDSDFGDTRFVEEFNGHQERTLSAEYDKLGLRSSTTCTYEYDVHGSWIKQSCYAWTRGAKEPRLVSVVTRRITYY